MNHLLNCVRVHLKAPTVSFDNEFKDAIEVKRREYAVDMRDPCWASKKIMADLGYDVFAEYSDLANSIQRIKRDLRNDKSIPYDVLRASITTVVNNTFPDESKSEFGLKEDVLFELSKRKPAPSKVETIPSQVDPVLFARYLNAVRNYGNKYHIKLAVARFILMKHNKMTAKQADAAIKSVSEEIDVDKNANSEIKKRINELIRANKV